MRAAKTLFDKQQITAVRPTQPPTIKVGNTPIEIALGIDEQGRTTARKLYLFLELAKGQFSRWARANITENDFAEENIDWWGFDINVEGNKTVDYTLTATFAKKLAMTSNSVRGEQAREYFIKVEEQLKKAVISLQSQNTQSQQHVQIIQQKITLDEIVLLTQEQAVTRYNIGKCNLRILAEDIGAVVKVGAGKSRILYHRKKLDDYFEKYSC